MRWLAFALISIAAACRAPQPAAPIATTSPATTKPAEPRRGKVVTDTHVEILDPIKFLPGSATLDPTSTRIIDAIASTLTGNPSIKLVAVQAFGADALTKFQAQLGADRAQVIVDALIARGVERKRLVAEGDAQPPAGYPNAPVFLILERSQ